MKKFKYKFSGGLSDLNGEKNDIEMLETFAKMGYYPIKLSDWGFYKLIYTGEKVDYKYTMDFADIGADDEGFNDYLSLFVEQGWEYVLSWENVHFFKSTVDVAPIYSDTVSMAMKYENMQKMMMNTAFLTK